MKDFGPEQLAKDVRATLKALKLSGPITLLGHSMGGRVALQYAADYPEDLKLLVIEDMAPRPFKSFQAPFGVQLHPRIVCLDATQTSPSRS